MIAALTSFGKVVGICLAILVVVLITWNHSHKKLDEVQRLNEATRLALQGQLVFAQKSAGALKDDYTKLLAANMDLQAAFKAAKTVAPDSKVINSARLDTEIIRVTAPPREPIAGQLIAQPTTVPTAPSVAPVCVLAQGDTASIEVQEITLQTKLNNFLLVGMATAWRETPTRAKLVSGPFQASLSNVSSLSQRPEPRWGAGILTGCNPRTGCSLGGGVMIPPWKPSVLGFSLRLEPILAVQTGADGLQFMGWLGFRW